MINLTPVKYSSVRVGEFYFRTPDCVVLFVVESRESDKLSVLVGRVLGGREKGVDNFDLKRILPTNELYKIKNFPLDRKFKIKLKEAGHYYNKAVEACSLEELSVSSWFEDHATNIKRSVDYLAVGRKLVGVTENQTRFYPHKRLFVYAPNRVWSRRLPRGDQFELQSNIPPNQTGWKLGESISSFPIKISGSFEVVATPIVEGNQDVLDMLAVKAREEYESQEDRHVMNALMAIAKAGGHVKTKSSFTEYAMRCAFDEFGVAGRIATKVVGHPLDISAISSWQCCDEATTRERLTHNLFGHLWTADLHAVSCMDVGTLLITDHAPNVGKLLLLEPIVVDIREKCKGTMTYFYTATVSLGVYEDSCLILKSEDSKETADASSANEV